LKHEIDTGSVIFQEKEPIHEEDNVGTVYERLMHLGAKLVLKTVRAIESGVIRKTRKTKIRYYIMHQRFLRKLVKLIGKSLLK
jgi:methionyl-tRNA formyltransferase